MSLPHSFLSGKGGKAAYVFDITSTDPLGDGSGIDFVNFAVSETQSVGGVSLVSVGTDRWTGNCMKAYDTSLAGYKTITLPSTPPAFSFWKRTIGHGDASIPIANNGGDMYIYLDGGAEGTFMAQTDAVSHIVGTQEFYGQSNRSGTNGGGMSSLNSGWTFIYLEPQSMPSSTFWLGNYRASTLTPYNSRQGEGVANFRAYNKGLSYEEVMSIRTAELATIC